MDNFSSAQDVVLQNPFSILSFIDFQAILSFFFERRYHEDSRVVLSVIFLAALTAFAYTGLVIANVYSSQYILYIFIKGLSGWARLGKDPESLCGLAFRWRSLSRCHLVTGVPMASTTDISSAHPARRAVARY